MRCELLLLLLFFKEGVKDGNQETDNLMDKKKYHRI